MKQHLLIFFSAILILSSCVSKKKYTEMQNEKSTEKNVLEDVLNRLAVENDSLTKLIYTLDSLYRFEREKNNNVVTNKSLERGFKVKPRRSLLSGKEEYDKKAIFLYNFLSYIFWPEDKSESFAIGIVGESPIKQALMAQVYGKTVNKLPINVESYNPATNYKMLFFTEAGQSQFNKVKKQLSGKTVLFITENTLLENIGSHISLYVDGTKIRFTVNKPAIEKTRLKVSNSFYSLSDKSAVNN